jgi:1-acyl-sn-glycerol-3-phosphate acyltransferase
MPISKPKVTQENASQVYEYYRSHPGNEPALRMLHKLSSLAYHPRITYAKHAENKIDALLDDQTRLIIASNHIRERDQFPIAAMMQRGPLRRVIGNTVSIAKKSLFRTPLRGPLDMVGAVPVWRDDDFKPNTSGREKSDIHKMFFNLVVDRMAEDGASVFMFPEGTRNPRPRELGLVKPGIGRIVLNCVQRDVPVAVVPVGLQWPGDGSRHSFRPDIAVGQPLDNFSGLTVNQITRETQVGMVQALLSAQRTHI